MKKKIEGVRFREEENSIRGKLLGHAKNCESSNHGDRRRAVQGVRQADKRNWH